MSNRFSRWESFGPSERALLRERARDLARVEAAPRNTDELIEVLIVETRQQRYAIDLAVIDGIGEVQSIADSPRAPSFVAGLLGFRGEVLLACELLGLVTGATTEGMADLRRVVALRAHKAMALLVEQVHEVQVLPRRSFVASALSARPFILGTADSFVSLLDATALIDHAFGQLGAAAGD